MTLLAEESGLNYPRHIFSVGYRHKNKEDDYSELVFITSVNIVSSTTNNSLFYYKNLRKNLKIRIFFIGIVMYQLERRSNNLVQGVTDNMHPYLARVSTIWTLIINYHHAKTDVLFWKMHRWGLAWEMFKLLLPKWFMFRRIHKKQYQPFSTSI